MKSMQHPEGGDQNKHWAVVFWNPTKEILKTCSLGFMNQNIALIIIFSVYYLYYSLWTANHLWECLCLWQPQYLWYSFWVIFSFRSNLWNQIQDSGRHSDPYIFAWLVPPHALFASLHPVLGNALLSCCPWCCKLWVKRNAICFRQIPLISENEEEMFLYNL